MKKIVKNGEGHVTSEIARLSKMIETKAANEDKIEDFEYRVNILGVFQTMLDVGEEGGDGGEGGDGESEGSAHDEL
jgi:hypothetical protein